MQVSITVTEKKSYIDFQLVPKPVTLNDLERRVMTADARYLCDSSASCI